MKSYLYLLIIVPFFLQNCKPTQSENTIIFNDSLHTFSNIQQVNTTHLDWKVNVNFDTKIISGTATWKINNAKKYPYIHFDTYELTIKKVKVNGRETQYFLTPNLKNFGSGLSIPIADNDTVVSIEYSTGYNATALQWLSPEQTFGKKLPFLFTQCESIHARSLLPCQDAPINRITYKAEVTVPRNMMAIMSANNAIQKNETGIYTMEMDIPIPTYLIALAVGDISYQAIDQRSGVYAEPTSIEACAKELSDIPAMLQAAESLGGKYRWGKYDVLIAPPSFPIGGMENPKLTFATPTIIAGDKSLVSLIAHEMAHSWSGNLVTNATWEDLWLNEGFTTYFERRIMEKITDKTYVSMLWELGYQDLLSDFNDMGDTAADTRLKVNLKGREPGDAFSNVPYEKGALLLKHIEEICGRENFDKWLNTYFNDLAFKPATTALFIQHIQNNLFKNNQEIEDKIALQKWIFEPGLPDVFTAPMSERLLKTAKAAEDFNKGNKIPLVQGWTTHEWLNFLRKINRPVEIGKLKSLDQMFKLTTTHNSEIAAEWFGIAIASNYTETYATLEQFLSLVGRKKFLEPLYMELIKNKQTQAMANEIFKKYKINYHPLTAVKIEKILHEKN